MELYRQKKHELELIPKGDPEYSLRFNELLKMLEEIRMNELDILEIEPHFIAPNTYDVMLTDLNHDLLMNQVSTDLNVQYLESPENPDNESIVGSVSGILWGPHMRPMVNLIISSTKFKKPVNIIFLVDTGCPYIYICETALNKLGFIDHMPSEFEIQFRSGIFKANMSPLVMPNGSEGHFKDINVLGASFLRYARSILLVDYNHFTFTIQMM